MNFVWPTMSSREFVDCLRNYFFGGGKKPNFGRNLEKSGFEFIKQIVLLTIPS